MANAGTNSTRESVTAVKEAQGAGADAILAVVPYYNKPTQSGMLAHFGAIAEATSLPVVIYNIPGRTGANMLPETLLELARRHRNVAGVKESSGDLKQIGTILRDRAAGFGVWAGDDHLFLPCLSLGADGVVGVASHLCSLEYRAMLDAFRQGRVDEAAAIAASLLPTHRRALCNDQSDSGQMGDGAVGLPRRIVPPAARRDSRLPSRTACVRCSRRTPTQPVETR